MDLKKKEERNNKARLNLVIEIEEPAIFVYRVNSSPWGPKLSY